MISSFKPTTQKISPEVKSCPFNLSSDEVLAFMEVTWCQHHYPGVETLEAAKQWLIEEYEEESWRDLMLFFRDIRFSTHSVYNMEVMYCGMQYDASRLSYYSYVLEDIFVMCDKILRWDNSSFSQRKDNLALYPTTTIKSFSRLSFINRFFRNFTPFT